VDRLELRVRGCADGRGDQECEDSKVKLSLANSLAIGSLLAILISAWVATRERIVKAEVEITVLKSGIAEVKSFQEILAQSMMNELRSSQRERSKRPK
jgi:hypothetical protein